jgi:DNA-binding transcriptional MocR family regulator
MADATRLAALLGPWRDGDRAGGPQFARLAAALAATIEDGSLDGVALPAERRLAAALGVSRSTVVRAYESLRRQGLVASRERSGTVVRPLRRRLVAPQGQMFQLAQLLGDEGGIDLSVASPAVDELVAGIGVSLAQASGHGYVPRGLPALRAAIAERLTAQGAPTTPDEVLITSGAHEGLTLLAGLLVGRHQPVAVDEVTYAGALEVLDRAGGVPVGVPGDRAGMRSDALRDVLARRGAGFVLLMPGLHNPAGTSIAAGRRPALLAAAAEFDALVVEDAALDDVRFDDGPPTLRALAPERVLSVGSFSKIAWGGLRVGWICGPRELIGRLARLKGARDIGAGALGQLAALQVLERIDELRAARREQARRRLELLRSELAARVPQWRLGEPEGGWSLWVDLGDCDGDAFTAAAARHGVLVSPGSSHVAGGGPSTHVRLAFAADDELLREGARRLAAAWADVAQPAATPAGTTSSQCAKRGSSPRTASP